jgi:hypothetical protein
LQLKRDIVASLRVLSDLFMMSQDYLLRVGSVICVTISKGRIPRINTTGLRKTWRKDYELIYTPIRTPRIQFKLMQSGAPARHCVLNCGVVEVKCPIPLEVL